MPFDTSYAATYDDFYREKDYRAECDTIESVFRSHGCAAPETVLDVGCGTGNHAVELARRGFLVTGVDRSESMAAMARKKAGEEATLKGNVDVVVGDMRELALGRSFDAALMMFAVLGYAITNDDVLQTLRSVRQHLKLGGLFVFDCWYGPAVLHERPGPRLRVVRREDGTELIRTAESGLDVSTHVCRVTFRVWEPKPGAGIDHFEEEHDVRFFFPKELELFLDCAGFSLLEFSAFPDRARQVSEETWNVLVVAQAR